MPKPRNASLGIVEAELRAAAEALHCGPLPGAMRAAMARPRGRAGIACPTRVATGAMLRAGTVLEAIATAGLSFLQIEMIWDRASGLSWKEIEAQNQAVVSSTLRLYYDEALFSVRQRLIAKRKSVGKRQPSNRTR